MSPYSDRENAPSFLGPIPNGAARGFPARLDHVAPVQFRKEAAPRPGLATLCSFRNSGRKLLRLSWNCLGPARQEARPGERLGVAARGLTTSNRYLTARLAWCMRPQTGLRDATVTVPLFGGAPSEALMASTSCQPHPISGNKRRGVTPLRHAFLNAYQVKTQFTLRSTRLEVRPKFGRQTSEHFCYALSAHKKVILKQRIRLQFLTSNRPGWERHQIVAFRPRRVIDNTLEPSNQVIGN